jgi:predicted transcriptional regulator
MEHRILLDPTGEHVPVARKKAPRPSSLEGLTVGLLDIGKARGDVFLNRLDERLTERGITVRRYAKPAPTRLVAQAVKAKMIEEVQLAVIGLAD